MKVLNFLVAEWPRIAAFGTAFASTYALAQDWRASSIAGLMAAINFKPHPCPDSSV